MDIKKGNIGINSLFYIMMILIFVMLLIFGFQKIFLVKDVLSEQKRIELKSEIKNMYEYCGDPLNKGNYKSFEINNNNNFNEICILGDDFYESKYSNYKDFVEVYNNGDNLLLIKSDYINGDENYNNYEIMDVIKLNVEKISYTFCNSDRNNEGTLLIKIECS